MTVASDSWRRIRRLRATPPFVAARDVDPRRTRVFQAALTQAEELWEAASAVGAASRPLPLFYCLSQAGRAICAAWKTEGPWEPTGHGLSSRRQADDVGVPSFAVRVTREAEPMYGSVAEATDTTVFEGDATVAALWASLPDLPRAKEITAEQSQPLYIESAWPADGKRRTPLDLLGPKAAQLTFPRPRWAEPYEFGADEPLQSKRVEDDVLLQRIRDGLADYPMLAGATVEIEEIEGTFQPLREPVIRVPDENGESKSLHQFADSVPAAAGRRSVYVVRPRIGSGDGEPPSQLMTLWALLYAFSQLARYHPALWVAALNPDESTIAVDLEHALDASLELVPDLLLPAISNGAIPRLIREQAERERLQQEADAAQ